VPYTISLNNGSNSTSFAARKMNVNTNFLNYNLYLNTGRTSVWGDGTAGTATVADSMNMLLGSGIKLYPIYGGIPIGQNVPAGVYTDTITVTVTY
jgi:spore coat protein U-like protein